MRLAETRFQCRSTASAGLGSWALSTRSIAARAGFSAGSSSERCGNAGANAAGFHETQMTRRNLGIAGQIKLAEMAALPPFAQVIADMG